MKTSRHLLLVLMLLGMMSTGLIAQATSDTIIIDTSDVSLKAEKKGSIFSGRPGKAMLFSLVVPGSGQFYNKSYWKVPIVLGAVGGMGYLVAYNTRIYKCRKEAYMANIDGVPPQFPEYCDECDPGLENVTDPATLKILRDDANEARQLSIIGFSLVWLLNGIEAFVDAHLKEFDTDDNLSFEFGSKFDDPNAPMRVGVFVQF